MIVILAPHADDELIGCHSILGRYRKNCYVIYTEHMDKQREEEAKHLANHLDYPFRFLNRNNPTQALLDCVECGVEMILAPDPHWELHPSHKYAGSVAVEFCREHNIRFASYSTNMNAPYIKELNNGERYDKRLGLHQHFPSQRSLWENDHKYFLFEGICEWGITGV